MGNMVVLPLLGSVFLLVIISSFQFVGAVEYTISDQYSCESLGGTSEGNTCHIDSFTVNKNDSLEIKATIIQIHEKLENFGKLKLDRAGLVNVGSIINHYGGTFTLTPKSGFVNYLGTFSNEGLINNEGGDNPSTIFNNANSTFANKATGVIFNGNKASIFNIGIFYNNNIIFNDRSGLNNSGEIQEREIREILHGAADLIDFEKLSPVFINDSGGIIFNKQGSFFFNDRLANFTNGSEGIVFNAASSTIFNRGDVTNNNKIYSDCGGIIMAYQMSETPILEIPCT